MTRTPHTTDAARSRPTMTHPAAASGVPRLEHRQPAVPAGSEPAHPTQDDTTATGPAPTPLDRP